MNEKNDKELQEIICDCSGTTKAKIIELINNGADLDKIERATGACTGCGACDAAVLSLLGEDRKDD